MKVLSIYLLSRGKPIKIEFDKDAKLDDLFLALNSEQSFIKFGPVIFEKSDFIRAELEES